MVFGFEVDEVEVADIDEPACGLADDANDVFTPHEVKQEHGCTSECHPPESDGDDGLSFFLRGDDLHDHASSEDELAEESEDDPADGVG